MTYSTAVALFAIMPIDSKDRVVGIFDLICASSTNVRDAFTEAVRDEAYAITAERLLLEMQPAAETMQ